jgi:amino acid transporter
MKLNLNSMFRKKTNGYDEKENKLARELNVFDLTLLGVGSTFGTSIYIVIGSIIRKNAGPSVFFSCLIASLASFLSGLCYAELSARVPSSGSGYVYIYVTIGEILAFITGWTMILEYIIGSASVACALSQYIDALAGHQINDAFKLAFPIHDVALASHPNLLACSIVLIMTFILMVGLKDSVLINRLLVVVNIAIVALIVIIGGTRADRKYSNLSEKEVYTTYAFSETNNGEVCVASEKNCGSGGVLPYGYYGLIEGATTCFYAFIGFDIISTTDEKVKNPCKTLPLSIILTLIISSIAYASVSLVLSLMIPYTLIGINTPLVSAFDYVNINWAKHIVSIGVIISLSSGLYSQMSPIPRITYSMASDGLIFRIFSRILPKIKTPALIIVITGALTAILATLFDLENLVEMTSIGTLFAYTLVDICVLILRYRPLDIDLDQSNIQFNFKKIFNPPLNPTLQTSKLVNRITMFALILVIGIDLMLTFLVKKGSNILLLASIALLSMLLIMCVVVIFIQPQCKLDTFKVPIVPIISILSVLLNIFLMISLKTATWIRFIVWLVIGLIVYLTYGISHSSENKKYVCKILKTLESRITPANQIPTISLQVASFELYSRP